MVASPTGTTLNARIVRGPWPDELLAAYQGNTASTPLWSLQDRQSSIIAITDAAGTAPYTLGYDEYGQPRAGNAGRLMYTGQLWMPDWGLYHYKARAYHPGLGRFVQTDPVGYEQGMNLYAYVGLDPVNKTDPGGMQACGRALNCIEARRPDPNRTDRRTVTQNSAGDAAVISQASSYESRGNIENGARVDNRSPVAVDSSLPGDPSGAGPEVTQVRMTTNVNGNIISSTMHDVRGATSLAHSHPVNTSDPSPGPGDDAAVNAGFPNNIIHNGNVLVVEKVDGQFRVRITRDDSITRSDRREIQRDVDLFQRQAQ